MIRSFLSWHTSERTCTLRIVNFCKFCFSAPSSSFFVALPARFFSGDLVLFLLSLPATAPHFFHIEMLSGCIEAKAMLLTVFLYSDPFFFTQRYKAGAVLLPINQTHKATPRFLTAAFHSLFAMSTSSRCSFRACSTDFLLQFLTSKLPYSGVRPRTLN